MKIATPHLISTTVILTHVVDLRFPNYCSDESMVCSNVTLLLDAHSPEKGEYTGPFQRNVLEELLAERSIDGVEEYVLATNKKHAFLHKRLRALFLTMTIRRPLTSL